VIVEFCWYWLISFLPPQRSYCVLWGTLLFDYENEEDSKSLSIPKATIEVLGVSEWDGGSGRGNRANNAFLIVSHMGTKYYMTAANHAERDEWITQLRRALECNFANQAVAPYKPCKEKQARPAPSFDRICAKTRNTIASLASATICKVCGRAYSSSEYVQETSPFLQIGQEDSEKCCSDCKNAQSCVLWLKTLNYVHVMNLHEHSPEVLTDIQRFESSFQIRKRHSHRLEMASQLLRQGQITMTEFEELRRIDQDYRVEKVQEESAKFAVALEAIGSNMLMIINMLISPAASDANGRANYYQLIVKLLTIADADPALVDFYLPQIMQAHLIESMARTPSALIKVDLIQQALLVLAKKYPALALKMSWSLIAVLGDYSEKRVTQVQYASCACLLLQLEMIVCGEISSVSDNPLSTALADIIRPCGHQKQELAVEIGALFLSRRRLQEIYDEETTVYRAKRRLSNATKYKDKDDYKDSKDSSNGNGSSSSSGKDNSSFSIQEPKEANVTNATSCLELLKGIGVGPKLKTPSDTSTPPERGRSNSSINSNGSNKSGSNSIVSNNPLGPVFDIGYCEQIRFIDRLSELVESLRFIHRPFRTDALCRELAKWNQHESMLGWDPTVVAGEPSYRLKHINVEDCRVFRTKARAPSLIVCEVLRQDIRLNAKGDPILTQSPAVVTSPLPPHSTHISSSLHSSHHIVSAVNNNGVVTPTRLSSDSQDEESGGPLTHNVHRRRASSILACDSADAIFRTTDISQVDGLVDQSILQAIEEIQRSKDDAEPQVPMDRETAKAMALTMGMNDTNTDANAASGGSSPGSKFPPQVDVDVDTQSVASVSSTKSLSIGIADTPGSSLGNISPKAPSSPRQQPGQEPTTPRRHSASETLSPTPRRHSASDASANSGSNGSGSASTKSTSNASAGPEFLTPRISRKTMNGFSGNLVGNHGNMPLPQVTNSASKLSTSSQQSFSVFKAALDTVNDVGNTMKNNTAPIRGMLMNILPMSPPPKAPPARTFSPFAFSGETAPSNAGNAGVGLGSHSRSASDLQSMAQAGSSINTSRHSDGDNGNTSARGHHGKKPGAPLSSLMMSNPFAHLVSGSTDTASVNSQSNSGKSARGRSVSSDHFLATASGDQSDVHYLVVQNAQKLLKDGQIDQAEYDLLVKSDGRYQTESAKVDEELTMTRVETAYGESWEVKRERILGSRAHLSEGSSSGDDSGADDYWPMWDMRCFIVKSNDDLRQEVCCLQIMQLCKEIFEEFGLSSQLWLKPYRIVSTGSRTGLVQVLPDTMSLDALKKTAGFQSLPFFFKSTYGSSPERITRAKQNFMSSLAAYSLFCYILSIKDRHNGNMLIDTEGHIIHIDFGFMLSIAPGGAFSLETAPFKLTEEMVEVLGGLESKLFGEFVKAFTAGFYALRANAETICSTLQILAQNSPYPCFSGKDVNVILDRLRSRFRNDLSVKEVVQHCLDLIIQSYGNYGTKQYDSFQWYTNGIVP
jgi:hypothetical protein